VESGNTIAKQGDALAAWAHKSILAFLRLSAPPDVDLDEEEAEEA
jgi:hypothetical protein